MTETLVKFWPVLPAVIVPVMIARVLVRGSWQDILKAYGIWVVMLVTFGFLTGGNHGEGYGWALIFSLIYSFLAIPLLVLLIKLWRFMTNSRVTL